MSDGGEPLGVTCYWCQKVGQGTGCGEWVSLPAGWYTLVAGAYDSYDVSYACSRGCVEAADLAAKMRAEYIGFRSSEFSTARHRLDVERQRLDARSEELAKFRMTEKYGVGWEEKMKQPEHQRET